MNRIIWTLIVSLAIAAFTSNAQNPLIITEKQFNDSEISLSTLKKLPTNLKIVGLGEGMHNVGTTFEGKIKVVKYLHDSLGFDLLIFESGFFDCYKANQMLKTDSCNARNFFDALFSLWNSKEMIPLYNYIRATQHSSRPLNIAGMDVQFLNYYSYLFFEQDFRRFIAYVFGKYNINITIDDLFYASLRKEFRYSNTFAKLPAQDTLMIYNTVQSILKATEACKILNDSVVTFWRQNCLNLLADATRNYRKSMPVRDSMMAVNVRWLLSQSRSEKAIIWAATIHLAKSTKSIANKVYQSETTGKWLKEFYGDSYYSIGFTQNKGRGGWRKSGLLSYKFGDATKGSLEEYLAQKYNADFLFLNLRDDSTQKELLQSHITKSKILGTKEIRMDIIDICDAVFYIKKQIPPTYKFER